MLENTCFENSTASVKGYLVTDLDFGVPCAIKVSDTVYMKLWADLVVRTW